MTVTELAERMGPEELMLWISEDYLRSLDERDRALEARARALVKRRA